MIRDASPNFSTPVGKRGRAERPSIITCSVIIPVYNERDNVRAVHQAFCAVAEAEPSLDWEFLFVEDGSTDDTFAILVELNRTDPRVKVVRLSRNYGSHTCAAAGRVPPRRVIRPDSTRMPGLGTGSRPVPSASVPPSSQRGAGAAGGVSVWLTKPDSASRPRLAHRTGSEGSGGFSPLLSRARAPGRVIP